MSIPFNSNIELNKNEIQNALWHKLSSAPSSPTEGQYYYDTASKRLKYYNGTSWVTIGYGADVLNTARTISFTGDVSGSFAFDGSANKSVSLQVADDSHYHTANSIRHSDTYTLGGTLSPLYQPMIDTGRANRLAFVPASSVIIEYSTDGGETWTDYGATDAQKRSLFAMNRSAKIYVGSTSSTVAAVTTDMQTRITVNKAGIYCHLDKAYFWFSTQRSHMQSRYREIYESETLLHLLVSLLIEQCLAGQGLV